MKTFSGNFKKSLKIKASQLTQIKPLKCQTTQMNLAT